MQVARADCNQHIHVDSAETTVVALFHFQEDHFYIALSRSTRSKLRTESSQASDGHATAT